MKRVCSLLAAAALVAAFSFPAFAQSWTTPGPSTGTGYPQGSQPVTASAIGTTGAVAATLPAAVGRTTYLCSVQIGEAGTGTSNGTATNTISGTLNYVVSAPGNFSVAYSPCVPANALNTTIPVSVGANASATSVAVTATGYQF